jgi:hypothetical protein
MYQNFTDYSLNFCKSGIILAKIKIAKQQASDPILLPTPTHRLGSTNIKNIGMHWQIEQLRFRLP